MCFTIKLACQTGKAGSEKSFYLAFLYCFGWLITGILRVIFVSLEFGLPQVQTLMPFGPAWKYSYAELYLSKPLFAATTVFAMLTDYQLILVWMSVTVTSSKLVMNSKRLVRIMSGCVLVRLRIGSGSCLHHQCLDLNWANGWSISVRLRSIFPSDTIWLCRCRIFPVEPNGTRHKGAGLSQR